MEESLIPLDFFLAAHAADIGIINDALDERREGTDVFHFAGDDLAADPHAVFPGIAIQVVEHRTLALHGRGELDLICCHGPDDVLAHFTFGQLKRFQIFRKAFVCLERFLQIRITIRAEQRRTIAQELCESAIRTAEDTDFLPEVLIAQDGFMTRSAPV